MNNVMMKITHVAISVGCVHLTAQEIYVFGPRVSSRIFQLGGYLDPRSPTLHEVGGGGGGIMPVLT